MDIAADYRPGYNPEFLARVRERKRLEERAAAKKAAEERIRAAAMKRQELTEHVNLIRAREKRDERLRHRLLRQGERRLSTLVEELAARNNSDAGNTTMRKVFERFCEQMLVSPQAVLGRSRQRDLVKIRHMAWAEVRLACKHKTVAEIARFFGRDHTTVLYAFQKMGIPSGGAIGNYKGAQ